MKIKIVLTISLAMSGMELFGMWNNQYPPEAYPSAPPVIQEEWRGYSALQPSLNNTRTTEQLWETCKRTYGLLSEGKDIKEGTKTYSFKEAILRICEKDRQNSRTVLQLTLSPEDFLVSLSNVSRQEEREIGCVAFWMKKLEEKRKGEYNDKINEWKWKAKRLEDKLQQSYQRSFWSKHPFITFVAGGIFGPPLWEIIKVIFKT